MNAVESQYKEDLEVRQTWYTTNSINDPLTDRFGHIIKKVFYERKRKVFDLINFKYEIPSPELKLPWFIRLYRNLITNIYTNLCSNAWNTNDFYTNIQVRVLVLYKFIMQLYQIILFYIIFMNYMEVAIHF
jgi:hypothetical protein